MRLGVYMTTFPNYSDWKSAARNTNFDVDAAWEAESKRPDFYKAIKKNVQVFTNAIKAKKDVDPGFKAILERDIVMLMQQKYAVNPEDVICKELYETAKELQKVVGKLLTTPRVIPGIVSENIGGQVGPKEPLLTIPESVVPSTEELKVLVNKGCSIRRIPQDESSFFGSIAAHLIGSLQLEALLRNVPQLLKEGLLQEDPSERIQACLEAVHKGGVSVEDVLQDSYAFWVKLLTQLAKDEEKLAILEKILGGEIRVIDLGAHTTLDESPEAFQILKNGNSFYPLYNRRQIKPSELKQ